MSNQFKTGSEYHLYDHNGIKIGKLSMNNIDTETGKVDCCIKFLCMCGDTEEYMPAENKSYKGIILDPKNYAVPSLACYVCDLNFIAYCDPVFDPKNVSLHFMVVANLRALKSGMAGCKYS